MHLLIAQMTFIPFQCLLRMHLFPTWVGVKIFNVKVIFEIIFQKEIIKWASLLLMIFVFLFLNMGPEQVYNIWVHFHFHIGTFSLTNQCQL